MGTAEDHHDGFYGFDPTDRGIIAVAFDSTQVKSATGNRGTFDPNDPRITYSIGLPLEVASRIERAAATKPLELEAVQDADKATVRKAAAARAKELFKDGIVNQDTGRVVTLSGESWRELKTFTASPEKVAVLQRIDETVKGAVWLTGAHVDDRPEKAKFKELGGKYHYLAMPVKIGKDSGVALLVIQKDSSGRNLYQINEVSIKKASDKIDPDHKSGDSAETLPTSGHIRTFIEDFVKRKSNLIDSQATFSIGVEWTGFEGDPEGAIQKLKDDKKGVAIGVLSHPAVEGRIDLPWGEYDPETGNGYGLSKILSKNEGHAATLNDLQGFLDSLPNVSLEGKNRIVLGSEDGAAVVRLDWNGESRNWLMTAYYKKESPLGDDSRPRGLQPSAEQIPTEAITNESLGLNSRKVKQIDTPAFKSWFGVIPKWSMRTASRWWFIILNSEVRGQRTEASG